MSIKLPQYLELNNLLIISSFIHLCIYSMQTNIAHCNSILKRRDIALIYRYYRITNMILMLILIYFLKRQIKRKFYYMNLSPAAYEEISDFQYNINILANSVI
jgi:uncharacterized membrane protein